MDIVIHMQIKEEKDCFADFAKQSFLYRKNIRFDKVFIFLEYKSKSINVCICRVLELS